VSGGPQQYFIEFEAYWQCHNDSSWEEKLFDQSDERGILVPIMCANEKKTKLSE